MAKKPKPFDCVVMNSTMPPIEVSLWHDRVKLKKRLAERGIEIELSNGCEGQTFSADTGKGTVHFVLIEGCGKRPMYEDLALIAHEAVHVAMDWFEGIGEEEPSKEEWCYAVQAACSGLFDQHLMWVDGRLNQ